jgi:cation diffusion facilitator CzcD-associated flavoprotein CzcO
MGYYDYEGGYTPELRGQEKFRGPIVHPQKWPEELDYTGKRVVVIGSGATAVTLVPAMAEHAAHVTMLQRSPSYVASLPASDVIAKRLRRVLPERVSYAATRWKNVLLSMMFFQLARRRPGFVKRLLRKGARAALGRDFDVDTHFAPHYNPWDERLCVVPDGDLFRALRSGRASVVTDHIESFTETGIRLRSGAHLEADIIITATGLNLKLMGGVSLIVDGQPVDLAQTTMYKGMMYSDVPNLASAFGYTNASWTLRCDLTAEYVCKLLNYMQRHHYASCTPRRQDGETPTEPILNLSSGYVRRALDLMPRQAARSPWHMNQNYLKDLALLRYGSLEDEMEFATPGQSARG